MSIGNISFTHFIHSSFKIILIKNEIDLSITSLSQSNYTFNYFLVGKPTAIFYFFIILRKSISTIS